MKSIFFCFIIYISLFINILVPAQETGKYNPREAFDPLFDINSGTVYRSKNGEPGPEYWTNRADYKITARLDTDRKIISGNEVILYTNNSPDSLSYFWLELDQNRFKKNSKSYLTSSPSLEPEEAFIGGFNFKSVKIEQNGKISEADYIIDDTQMQIRLNNPMVPNGGRIKIEIEYSFTLAPRGHGRSGWMETKNGIIYDVSLWYPRMDVYDDLDGWNTLPFLDRGEFYLDYGNFDVSLNVPSDQIVVSSGKLLNPKEVLTNSQIKRLAQAYKSDKTIFIRTQEEVQKTDSVSVQQGRTTWHFNMINSRDFSWASSNAFIWDAAKINLPGKKECIAMSVYPVESIGDSAWSKSTQYLKHSIEIYSKDWYEYPYPTAVNVAGPVAGMEFPGIIFNRVTAKGTGIWMVTNHEIGHNWFPMIVGSNERKNAWMDEGFDTFMNIYSYEEYNNGEFAPKRDNEYAPKAGNPAKEIIPVLLNSKIPPLMTYADAIPDEYFHSMQYYKAALGLVLLREYILGHKQFDYAFKSYINDWAYKHPAPEDFFRTMNNASGENLNWFWKGWFINNWKLDQAVQDVKYINDNPSQGAIITITNNDQLIMPVTLQIDESNGTSGRVRLPVEIWQKGSEWTLKYNSTSTIKKIVIDPDGQLPDINESNNVWETKTN